MLSNEKQLIEKVFYETFLNGDQNTEPIQILGEAFFEEQKKDIPDLSAIRFAQGELYFHFKDYETAIFKWESIHNELEPWAKKNIADAYLELGLLPNAEDIYKSIQTENLTLHTEISLQLFFLYVEKGKREAASQTIKDIVALNPDYENVTRLARAFFEEGPDWPSAIELAQNEAVRLKSIHWYEVLKDYVEKGVTKIKEPDYFEDALVILAEIDTEFFEELVTALWNSYKHTNAHLSWIHVINRVIAKVEQNPWSQLSQLFEESFFELINGTYLMKEVGSIIPSLLMNWMKICDANLVLSASAAIIAWNEMFPGTINESKIYEAEKILLEMDMPSNRLDEAIRLAEDIQYWAGKQDLQLSKTLSWITNTIKSNETFKLLMVGTSESGKSTVLNAMLHKNILPDENSAFVMLEYSDGTEILEVSETDIQAVDKIEMFPSYRYHKSFHVKLENNFLQKNQITFIDSSDLVNEQCFSSLNTADGILFILNANLPFTEEEQKILGQIKKERPEIPIHFLLNKMDGVYNEKEAIQLIEEVSEKVKPYDEKAKFFAFSPQYERFTQLSDFSRFLDDHFKMQYNDLVRTTNLLYFDRKMISYLLNKRIDKENRLVDSIQWNEEMAAKLNGAVHQIGDLEGEKGRSITMSFRSLKESMKAELMEEIPKLLQGCSDYIKEDSDFGKIHLELNEEMNKKVESYLKETAMPKYYQSMQNWIEECLEDFNQVQARINEMCESFNGIYGEEKLDLQYDFKVLDDWKRDADRITSGIHWENMNILLRFTPSQFLLKSAGKLFGGFSQNKSMIFNKYKQFIETENYQDIADQIANRFLQQFELFEKSIERDIAIFFRNPLIILNQTVDETRKEIAEMKEELRKMQKNPELYNDPLTFFELKLRQNEWLNQKESKMLV